MVVAISAYHYGYCAMRLLGTQMTSSRFRDFSPPPRHRKSSSGRQKCSRLRRAVNESYVKIIMKKFFIENLRKTYTNPLEYDKKLQEKIIQAAHIKIRVYRPPTLNLTMLTQPVTGNQIWCTAL